MHKHGPMSSDEVAAFIDTDKRSIVRVFMSRLRSRLDGSGWAIGAGKGGGHEPGEYQLGEDI